MRLLAGFADVCPFRRADDSRRGQRRFAGSVSPDLISKKPLLTGITFRLSKLIASLR